MVTWGVTGMVEVEAWRRAWELPTAYPPLSPVVGDGADGQGTQYGQRRLRRGGGGSGRGGGRAWCELMPREIDTLVSCAYPHVVMQIRAS